MAKRIYLDSSVILAFLKGEAGRGEQVKAALFNASGPGSPFQFVTSVLSLTEIAYIENLPGSLEDGFARIDDFWRTAPILLVDVNATAATHGRSDGSSDDAGPAPVKQTVRHAVSAQTSG